MFAQLFLGSTAILLTVVIQVLFISTAIEALVRRGAWLVKPPFLAKTIVVLIAVVLWLILGISLSAWSWAGLLLLVGAFQDIEPALYFSIVTFTTLGYGDITVDTEWRILASFAAVAGLIIFGLNTAFLVEFTHRLLYSPARNPRIERPE